jgi:hypothetical protein
VADQQTSIDLRTLEQVRHLLETTTFASIDDLAGVVGALPDEVSNRRSSRPEPRFDRAGATPLPRRR